MLGKRALQLDPSQRTLHTVLEWSPVLDLLGPSFSQGGTNIGSFFVSMENCWTRCCCAHFSQYNPLVMHMQLSVAQHVHLLMNTCVQVSGRVLTYDSKL